MLAIYKNDRPVGVCYHFDGLVQDYSISIANALEMLQSCTKPSIYLWCLYFLSSECDHRVNFTKCSFDKKCIPNYKLCDGLEHCADGEDEKDCGDDHRKIFFIT